jgi:hypothetical protein
MAHLLACEVTPNQSRISTTNIGCFPSLKNDFGQTSLFVAMLNGLPHTGQTIPFTVLLEFRGGLFLPPLSRSGTSPPPLVTELGRERINQPSH